VNRVLIAISGVVLAAGVEGLLARTGGFEVIRIIPSDEGTLRREVDRLRPAALIVDRGVALTQLAQAMEDWKPRARLRILVVHPEHNSLQVFDRQEIELQSGTDLIEVLRAE
jgi:hypothetical protein